MAQKAIPLVADADPVEVIYEDDDMIAVNKPPGVISAPKHRYTVSIPDKDCVHSTHTMHMLCTCSPALHCIALRPNKSQMHNRVNMFIRRSNTRIE